MLVPLALLAISPFTEIQIEGWKFKLGQEVATNATWIPVKAELTRQLRLIKRTVGKGPLIRLQKVLIWVNVESNNTQCMAYHPGRQWLSDHAENPDMARGVELANLNNFVSWTRQQPWMVLHELAHAYHDQFLARGFANPDVEFGFQNATAGKQYESVLHVNGTKVKHYALTNSAEYFAESTESYFGKNDFFPFVRPELKQFDPEAFSLMKKIWGAPVSRSYLRA